MDVGDGTALTQSELKSAISMRVRDKRTAPKERAMPETDLQPGDRVRVAGTNKIEIVSKVTPENRIVLKDRRGYRSSYSLERIQELERLQD